MDDLLTVEPAVAASPIKITSHDIKLGIRASRGQGYQTFFEVGNDTGTRVTRHADAVSIGIWPSTGHQIHGFEVKVSRGDFLNEMKNPGKSMPVFKHCHRWSLATPPGLVKTDELPPNWGLVTFDGRTLRTIKQAPLLAPEPVGPGFVAALVRRAGEADAELISTAVRRAKYEWDERAKKELDTRLAQRGQDVGTEAREAVAIVYELKQRLGVEYLQSFEIPEIVAALKVVRKMRIAGAGWQGIERLCGELERVSASAKELIGNVEKTMDEAGIERRRA